MSLKPQASYSISIDEMPINIAIYKITEGEIYFADMNSQALNTEKVAIENIKGVKLIEAFPGVKEFGLYDIILKVSNTGQSEEFDLKFYDDGRIQGWRKNHISKLTNELVMVTYEDLTEQKQLEFQFKKEKKLLEDAQELAHLGSWEWDIKTNSLYWSDEVFRIFGEEPQSFTPSYEIFTSYIPQEDLPTVEKAIEDALSTNKHYRIIHRILINNQIKFVEEMGTPYFDEQGEPIYMVGSVYDITEKHNFKLELQKYSDELQTIFKLNPHITLITDGDQLLEVNQKFLDFTGFTSLKDFTDAHHSIGNLFVERNHYLQAEMQGKPWVHYVANHPEAMHKAIIVQNEQEYTLLAHAKRYTLDHSVRYLVVLEDISNLELSAKTDFLTQLYNRNKMHEILEASHYRFERYQETYSLIMIDIDHFKRINDNFGHKAGDQALKAISTLFSKTLRTSDVCGRWGGEEFLILCPHTSHKQVSQMAEQLRKRVADFDFTEIGSQTISLGCITAYEGCSVEKLIEESDQALYKAKENGRNQVHCEQT